MPEGEDKKRNGYQSWMERKENGKDGPQHILEAVTNVFNFIEKQGQMLRTEKSPLPSLWSNRVPPCMPVKIL